MAHDRSVHNVTDPKVKLGWEPYTYRVTRNAVAQFACHTERELQVWLKSRRLKVSRWSGWRGGVRTALLNEAN
jgi:hypothetical protein